MDFLQRQIVDERKKSLVSTNVGSIGIMFLGAGFAPTRPLYRFGSSERDEFSFDEIARIFSRPPATRNIGSSSSSAERPATSSASFRDRELEWRRNNPQALKSFENEWVVLQGEEIIAHGRNPVVVINEARSRGVRTPYIFFVEPESENIVNVGL